MKGFLQLLQSQYKTEYVEIAHTELENALTTLEDLLQIARPDIDEPSEEINLYILLESMLTLFQDQVYRVEVKRNFQDREQTMFGRTNQLKKAFFNVLKNAFEAIEDKGSITITHALREDRIHLEISDTGMGMPEKTLGQLGNPFYSTKSKGTGMGLTQVYNTVYGHGGTIDVKSRPGEGTTFSFAFPVNHHTKTEVIALDLTYTKGQSMKQFFLDNRETFFSLLLSEENTFQELFSAIKKDANIDLNQKTEQIITNILDQRPHELVVLARDEGLLWAKHSLNIGLKLEWMQALRRIMWEFFYSYDKQTGKEASHEGFYELERTINKALDTYHINFFSSYTKYKDEILQSHRNMVEDLSVPIIPLSPSVAVLPLIGTVDTFRAKKIQEKILQKIGNHKIDRLIIDLSGVVYMDTAVVAHVFKIVEGMSIMGCTAVITGVRPEIANTLVNLGISFSGKIETRGTLEKALEEVFVK
ncbi:ATP-binding protein [Paenibacillus sp. TRM 82003]|nr:ATP-binding protein [Paenibacillus sp. TRM 82003]